jgi:hypothetical protein
MKTLKCDLCDHEAQGDTFEVWMNALKPHYGEVHAEVMKGKENLTEEEKKAEMQTWMDENKARFEAA